MKFLNLNLKPNLCLCLCLNLYLYLYTEKDYRLKRPTIEYENIWFRIVFERPDLEKQNYQSRMLGENVRENVRESVGENVGEKIKKRKRKNIIIRKIKNKVEFTYKMLAQELNVSEKTIERDIRELKNEDKIEFSGSSKKGKWKIVKNK